MIALDGNPVPSRRTVDTLFLAPAERADVIVEMNRPGVWILGATRDDDRKMGLGVVVEYAGQRGEPQWSTPPNSAWDYTIFGADEPVPAPDDASSSCSRKCLAAAAATTAGPSTASPGPTPIRCSRPSRKALSPGMTNKSGDNHPVHLHRHTFEVTKVGDKSTAGVIKDTINMTRFSTVEIDFIADDPGPALLHCHHQDHQDEGFMGMVTYL